MGYYPSDMMNDWLSEDTNYFDMTTYTWSWDEEESYESDEDKEALLEELTYDPKKKADEIIAACPSEDYIIVFHTGEWFESTEEAFLWKHENALLRKMLQTAYVAGAFHDPGEGFPEFFDRWAHG